MKSLVTHFLRLSAFLFVLMFAAMNVAFAQANLLGNADDYYTNRIYLKIKPAVHNHPLSILTFQNEKQWSELVVLLQNNGVQRLDRPFEGLKTADWAAVYDVQLDANRVKSADGLIKALAQLPYVEYAERVPIARSVFTPNDPQQGSQYNIGRIQAPAAWDIHKGGNCVVAIVDDAVRITHEDLAANIWVNPREIPNNGIDDDGNGYIDDINGYDVASNDNNPNPDAGVDDNHFSHGTHCAGIAGAVTNNGKGIASIGFNNKMMAVKTALFGDNNLPYAYNGVVYAMAAGARVISMSWGGGGFAQTLQDLFNTANSKGIVLVAAAGNFSSNALFYPAAYNNVIAVASTDQNDVKSGFSNYGSWIDVSAPGSNILSTLATTDMTYGVYSGTSMACPLVAGLAGLIRSQNPTFTPAQVEACLKSSVDNIDGLNNGFAGLLGAGRINAAKALACGAAPCLSVAKPTFTNGTTTGVTLNWATVASATAYKVEYKLASSATWLLFTTTNATTTQAIFSQLSAGTYDFRVTSVCTNNATGNPSPIAGYTVGGCIAPTQPTITNVTATGATISWNAVIGAISYDVEYKLTTETSTAWSLLTTTTNTQYTSNVFVNPPLSVDVRVVTNCSANSKSVPSPLSTFVTIGNCPVATNLVTGNITPNYAYFTWTAPPVMGLFYLVEYKMSSSATWINNSTATGTNTSLSNLTPNTSYDIRITTLCPDGSRSASFLTKTFTTLLNAVCAEPTNLNVANITSMGCVFTWTSVAGAASYSFDMKPTSVSTWGNAVVIPATSLSINMSGLLPNTSYDLRLTTNCTNGSKSTTTPIKPFVTLPNSTICPVPTTPSVLSISSNTASVSWTAVTGALRYRLEYKLSSGVNVWTSVTTTTPNFSLNGLISDIWYDVRIYTQCTNGSESLPSNPTSFKTLVAAPVFPDLTIQNALAPLSSTKGKLETVSFDVLNQGTAVAPLSKFRLLLSTDAVPDAMDIVLLQPDINPLGIGAKTGINAPIQIPTNIGTGNYYLLYQIDYTNAIAESNESNNLATRTIAIQDVSCTPTTSIGSSFWTTSSANVQWQAVVGAVSYRLEYKLSSATTWTAWATVTTITTNITGLQPATSYDLRVVTICASNAASAPSVVTSFKTLVPVCTDINEPNNTLAAATLGGENGMVRGSISTVGDVDYFKITPVAPNNNVSVMLTNLKADFNMELYDMNGILLSFSTNTGLNNERIYYNAAVAKPVYVKVYAVNNAVSSDCYLLTWVTDAQPFNCVAGTSFPSATIQSENATAPIVKKDNVWSFSLAPNPAVGNVSVSIVSEEAGDYNVSFFDVLGKIVLTKQVKLSEGVNVKPFDVQNLAHGLHLVRVTKNGKSSTQKLIIE